MQCWTQLERGQGANGVGRWGGLEEGYGCEDDHGLVFLDCLFFCTGQYDGSVTLEKARKAHIVKLEAGG